MHCLEDGSAERLELMKFLAKKGVGTRQLFAGNILKQPYFIDYGIKHRVVGDLENSDKVMESTFWIGVFPALEKRHLDYVKSCITEFFER